MAEIAFDDTKEDKIAEELGVVHTDRKKLTEEEQKFVDELHEELEDS